MKKKRSITLIEILIVIALIAIIGSALAVNMRGSLDKGRAFKSQQNAERIQEILMLEQEDGALTPQEIVNKWVAVITNSPLVKGKEVVKDGWGNAFVVTYDSTHNEFKATSTKLEEYKAKHESHRNKKAK